MPTLHEILNRVQDDSVRPTLHKILNQIQDDGMSEG